MKTSTSRNHGFSLIELIVVILIIGIIAYFAVPAASTILRGSQLTQGSQILIDQVSLARQQALTRNHMVEVRFIRYADPEVPGEVTTGTPDPTKGHYRAIQVFEILDNGVAVPVDKPALLPQGVVMTPANDLSTLIGQAQDGTSTPAKITTLKTGDPMLPRKIENHYDYVCFRFLPDGSTNLSATAGSLWFVTVVNMNDQEMYKQTGTKPTNFFTLQVDPVSGTTKKYRPSV